MTNPLTAVLVTLAAIVMLAKSIVEFQSARMKLKSEAPTPTAEPTISTLNHRISNLTTGILILQLVMYVLSAAFLITFAFGATSIEPVRTMDLALIAFFSVSLASASRPHKY